MLPVPGNVLVRSGQTVEANDIIAQTNLQAEHIVLDIARGLGVLREKANEYIQRSIGDTVPKDAAIATRSGLASRVVRAPASGKVVAIRGGLIVLQVKNEPFELIAGIPGTVLKVEAEMGAIIETSGAWIQGIWGNNQTATGVLEALSDSADHEITAHDLNPDTSGQILMAGHCKDSSVLKFFKDNNLGGLILGSMATKLISLSKRMPYPIIVIDGFGELPMNHTAFQLLYSNATREISVNSTSLNRLTGTRPEIIIPLPGAGSPPIPIDLENVYVGHKVRILRAPHLGEVGTVSALLTGRTRFPSGLRLPAVEVELMNQEKSVVPLANIEVLG
ncbi:MAG: hypothetical protein N2D54_13320 [Chloroflexota bacterium]